MSSVERLVEAMESIAPARGAEAWDNVGLIVGDASWPISGPVVLCIDLTEAVAREAIAMGAGAVVAYHPVLFHPVKRLTAGDGKGRALLSLIGAGVAVHSPHTALDAAEGGVADWLLECAGEFSERRALTPSAVLAPDRTHKVVVFVPAGEVDGVREAMGRAGAGVIGAYTMCSFGIPGRGTFLGGDGTNPAVGERGRLEEVEEIRLEMVCGESSLAGVVAALRGAHSYEEPAFDVYRVEAPPRIGVGAGRVGTLARAATVGEIAARVKASLGVSMVKVAGDRECSVGRVAVCPGAGAGLLDAAIGAGCGDGGGVFVTGEMRHHEVMEALDRGCGVVLAGHTNTERGYLPRLAERLREAGFEAVVSGEDRAPLEVV